MEEQREPRAMIGKLPSRHLGAQQGSPEEPAQALCLGAPLQRASRDCLMLLQLREHQRTILGGKIYLRGIPTVLLQLCLADRALGKLLRAGDW